MKYFVKHFTFILNDYNMYYCLLILDAFVFSGFLVPVFKVLQLRRSTGATQLAAEGMWNKSTNGPC